MNIDVSGLTIYPVKSLRSISLIESQVEPAGLRFDRRFMLVDEHGQFLNLRKLGKLLEFATKIEDETLIIQHGSADSIDFPLEQSPIQEHGSRSVVVWNSKLEASTVSRKVDEWFSRILGIKAGLVFMADFSKRPINSRFDRGSDLVSFADGYPILIVSEESVADLNSRFEDDVPIERFRPNVVARGGEAFQEDRWKKIRIGNSVLRATKPCARCVVTTLDQKTGIKQGAEPLKTLADYRKASQVLPDNFEEFDLSGNDVIFGMNFVPESYGDVVRLGDKIEILEHFD
jgi:uncharacterized protein YcbX